MKLSGLLLAGTLALSLHSSIAASEEYPTSPITIIVPFAAGGATDLSIRVIAEYATQQLGQPIIIDNRPGAGGVIALSEIVRSNPNGYTLGIGATSPLVIVPHTQGAPYDPATDITYIGRYVNVGAPLVVRTDAPWDTFKDLVEYARDNPAQLRWSGAAPLGVRHVVLAAAFQQEGVETTYVPYQGGANTMIALRNGEVDAVSVADYFAAYQAGDVKVIVRTDSVPVVGSDAPSLIDLGYPLAMDVFYALIGPADIPHDIVETWQRILEEATRTESFIQLSERLGLEIDYQPGTQLRDDVIYNYETSRNIIENIYVE